MHPAHIRYKEMKKIIVIALMVFFSATLLAQAPKGTYIQINDLAKSLHYIVFWSFYEVDRNKKDKGQSRWIKKSEWTLNKIPNGCGFLYFSVTAIEVPQNVCKEWLNITKSSNIPKHETPKKWVDVPSKIKECETLSISWESVLNAQENIKSFVK